MIYVKSILVGFATLILSVALLLGASILKNVRDLREQASGIGAVAGGITFNSPWISGVDILLAGVIVFAIGFAWEFRRSQRTLSRRSRQDSRQD